VIVLDGVLRRGKDKGVFVVGADIRVLRDMLFGTLEYAARSALLLDERKRQEHCDHTLTALMTAMLAVLRRPVEPAQAPDMMDRLEAAIDRLEAL